MLTLTPLRLAVPWLLLTLVVLAAAGMMMVPRKDSTAEPALAGTSLHGIPAPNFRLTDQFGHRISLSQFRGRPVALTFLEAHCRSTCPLVADKLRQAVGGRGMSHVSVLAISVDAEGDTTSAVRRFSHAHGMLHRWSYVTGNREQLIKVWRAYYIYAARNGASDALKQGHTSATFLIDREGRERVLLTGDPDEVTLRRDLRILAGLPVTTLAAASPAPEAGHPAPDVALPSLQRSRVDLSALRGRVALLNFWATWCTACRTETPRLMAWYRELRGHGFVVLGVDLQEDRVAVQEFVRRFHVSYPILLDESGAASARYNVVGLPTSFLIDRRGIIRSVHIGIVDSTYLQHKIKPLLGDASRG